MIRKKLKKNGKEYELVRTSDGSNTIVIIFDPLSKKPVSPFYGIDNATAKHFHHVTGSDPVDELAKQAEKEFIKEDTYFYQKLKNKG